MPSQAPKSPLPSANQVGLGEVLDVERRVRHVSLPEEVQRPTEHLTEEDRRHRKGGNAHGQGMRDPASEVDGRLSDENAAATRVPQLMGT
jgi:hypothetical protein